MLSTSELRNSDQVWGGEHLFQALWFDQLASTRLKQGNAADGNRPKGISLSAGWRHTLFACDGSVWSWGANENAWRERVGQTGQRTGRRFSLPDEVTNVCMPESADRSPRPHVEETTAEIAVVTFPLYLNKCPSNSMQIVMVCAGGYHSAFVSTCGRGLVCGWGEMGNDVSSRSSFSFSFLMCKRWFTGGGGGHEASLHNMRNQTRFLHTHFFFQDSLDWAPLNSLLRL